MHSPTASLHSGASHAFAEIIRDRRATPSFRSDPVPADVIDTALTLAAQAPSGYNFQPWRFLVLSDAEQRKKLQAAAFNQAKIAEAPVVVIAFGQREGWKEYVDEIVRQAGTARGMSAEAQQKQKANALAFLAKLDPAVWLNRQVMIAFTHLMLAVESLGWDTAPMEGFDADAVRKAFELPTDTEVVALLAIGRAKDNQTPHPGRLGVSRIAFRDRYREPYQPFASSES